MGTNSAGDHDKPGFFTLRLPSAARADLQQRATAVGMPATTLVRTWIERELYQAKADPGMPAENGSFPVLDPPDDAIEPAIAGETKTLLAALLTGVEDTRTALLNAHRDLLAVVHTNTEETRTAILTSLHDLVLTASRAAAEETKAALLQGLRDLLTAVHASAEETRTALRMHDAMMRQLAPEILGTLVMVLWLVQNIYGEWRDAPISEVTGWVRTERARRVQELFERAEKAARDGVS